MNTEEVLLKTVVRIYGLVRRLYLAGKISRDDWHDINDEITQFFLKEID